LRAKAAKHTKRVHANARATGVCKALPVNALLPTPRHIDYIAGLSTFIMSRVSKSQH
jgi:hypothetical protein